MSAVTDPVDRYRHGVLIGNYVEDKFGTDLLEQVPILPLRNAKLMPQNLPPLKTITILGTLSTGLTPLSPRKIQLPLISTKPPLIMTRHSTRSQKVRLLITSSIANKLIPTSPSSGTMLRGRILWPKKGSCMRILGIIWPINLEALIPTQPNSASPPLGKRLKIGI